MELDFGTLIIGALTVAVCATPFVLTIGGRKKREKQMMRSLAAMAEQRQCRVGQHEFCGNYALAVDEAGRYVFFHKRVKEQVEEQAIDLLDIKACKPVNIGKKMAHDRVVERLGLEFVPKDPKKREIFLELYNNDHSFQLRGELQSMERWAKLINDSLMGIRPRA